MDTLYLNPTRKRDIVSLVAIVIILGLVTLWSVPLTIS